MHDPSQLNSQATTLRDRSMRVRYLLVLAFIVVAIAACGRAPVLEDETGATPRDAATDLTVDLAVLEWPREIVDAEGTVVIYQPQLDSFSGHLIEARSAVSVTRTGETAPVFGAVWLRSALETNHTTRTATLTSVEVSRVRFPEATPEGELSLATFLEREIESWEVELSLDRLSAAIEAAERGDAEVRGLNNEPPRILVRYDPAVLIFIDGEPVLRYIDDSQLMEVVNTPYLMVLYPPTNTYYLNAGPQWFAAREVSGPWSHARNAPDEVVALTPYVESEETIEGMPLDDRVPEIIVSTVPAELIFIDGQPALSPIAGTDLMYVSNTDSDVLFKAATQFYYVLLAGRWYESTRLDGQWTFVPSDELPTDFARIPLESENGHLLAHVAGTEIATDAALDAQIPQTAAIPRDQTIEVSYDGAPRFSQIEGTDVAYAVNANGFVVLLIEGRYFCCYEAVWYEARSESGPWIVCDSVPEAVYTIPPSSPAYPVTYVYVYQSTPEVVYVGYTSGYTGTYIVNGCVVYGTGYYYKPYCVASCSTWPSTWGFHVRYNPYTGWTFGVSYISGPFHFTIGYNKYVGVVAGGWFGPAWYRPRPRYAYRAGYRAGFRHGYWHGYRHGSGHRPPPGYRPPHAHPYGRSNMYHRTRETRAGYPPTGGRDARGLYDSRASQDAIRQADRRASIPEGAPNRAAPSRDRTNNVYTDRNGEVYRRDNNGNWQHRQGSSWQDSPKLSGGNLGGSRPSTGAAAQPPGRSVGSQPSASSQTRAQNTTARRSGGTNSLEQDHKNRQRGNQRVEQYSASSPPSRSSGAKGGRR